jgi:hypothetical protein
MYLGDWCGGRSGPYYGACDSPRIHKGPASWCIGLGASPYVGSVHHDQLYEKVPAVKPGNFDSDFGPHSDSRPGGLMGIASSAHLSMAFSLKKDKVG